MKAKKVVVGLGVRKSLGTFPKRLREERRLKHRGFLQHVGQGGKAWHQDASWSFAMKRGEGNRQAQLRKRFSCFERPVMFRLRRVSRGGSVNKEGKACLLEWTHIAGGIRALEKHP